MFLIFRTLDNLNFALSNCHKRFAKIHTFSIDLNSYERVILFSSVSFVFQIPIKIYEHLLLMNQLSFCKFLFWHRFMSLFGVKWSTFYWNHLYEFYLNLYLNYGQLSTHIWLRFHSFSMHLYQNVWIKTNINLNALHSKKGPILIQKNFWGSWPLLPPSPVSVGPGKRNIFLFYAHCGIYHQRK